MLLITVWLGVSQLALLGVGKLIVQHSAHRAARAAIVVLDDDPSHYDDEPRRSISANDGARLNAIRAAAYAPLATLAAPLLDETTLALLDAPTLRSALTSSLQSTALGLLYNRVTAAVVLEKGGVPAETFAPRDAVTARVTYLFLCRVPLGRSLICKSYHDITSEKEMKEKLSRVELPDVQKVLGLSEQYFLALEGEETLPLQGAEYYTERHDAGK